MSMKLRISKAVARVALAAATLGGLAGCVAYAPQPAYVAPAYDAPVYAAPAYVGPPVYLGLGLGFYGSWGDGDGWGRGGGWGHGRGWRH